MFKKITMITYVLYTRISISICLHVYIYIYDKKKLYGEPRAVDCSTPSKLDGRRFKKSRALLKTNTKVTINQYVV